MTHQPSFQLWKRQGEYFDIPTSNLTPSQIRDNLAALAGEVIGKDKTAAVRDLLTNKTTPNGGVDVTNDLKYTGMSIHNIKAWDDFQHRVYSQVQQAEWHTFLPYRPLGWSHCRRGLEQLGREGVVGVPHEESSCLRNLIVRSTRM